jgi:hypothetical protein
MVEPYRLALSRWREHLNDQIFSQGLLGGRISSLCGKYLHATTTQLLVLDWDFDLKLEQYISMCGYGFTI